MKQVIILLFIIILFLFGCSKSKEMSFTNKLYVQELINNSNLSIQLMKKIELTEEEKAFYAVPTYYDDDSIYGEIEGLGFSYPSHEKNSDVYITQITIYTDKYNILGLTIGDDFDKVVHTMEQYGYSRDLTKIPNFVYKKGELHVRVDMTPDNHIEEITVSVYQNRLIDTITIYD